MRCTRAKRGGGSRPPPRSGYSVFRQTTFCTQKVPFALDTLRRLSYNLTMTTTNRTCPCCLGSFETHGAARMVRHGWRAFNVRHGTQGGFHSSPCKGTNQPMFESPEGLAVAREHLTTELQARLADLEEYVARLQERPETLTYQAREYDTTARKHVQVTKTVTETENAQTYERVLERLLAEGQYHRDQARRAVEAMEDAIAHWVEGDAPTAAQRKLRPVHLAHHQCAHRDHDGKSPRTTTDLEGVTCEACKAELEALKQAAAEFRDYYVAFHALRAALREKTHSQLYSVERKIAQGRRVRVALDGAHKEVIASAHNDRDRWVATRRVMKLTELEMKIDVKLLDNNRQL